MSSMQSPFLCVSRQWRKQWNVSIVCFTLMGRQHLRIFLMLSALCDGFYVTFLIFWEVMRACLMCLLGSTEVNILCIFFHRNRMTVSKLPDAAEINETVNKSNVLNDCSCNSKIMEFHFSLELKKKEKTSDFSCHTFFCLFVHNHAIPEASVALEACGSDPEQK